MVNPQGNNTLWRWDGSPRHPASRIAVPVDHTQGGQVLDLCHLHLPDLGVLLAKEVGWDSFWSFCSTVYNRNYFKHDWPDDIFLLLSGGVLKRIAVCKPSICIYIQSHTYCIYIYISKKHQYDHMSMRLAHFRLEICWRRRKRRAWTHMWEPRDILGQKNAINFHAVTVTAVTPPLYPRQHPNVSNVNVLLPLVSQ